MLRARHEPKTITSGHGPPWYPEARVTLSTRELCGIEAIVTVFGAGKRCEERPKFQGKWTGKQWKAWM